METGSSAVGSTVSVDPLSDSRLLAAASKLSRIEPPALPERKVMVPVPRWIVSSNVRTRLALVRTFVAPEAGLNVETVGGVVSVATVVKL